MKLAYQRILVKFSGEALRGKREFGIDPEFVAYLAQEIRKAAETGVQIAIVTGGGNIFRGVAGSAKGIDRSTADYMGMLATIFNGLALQDALEKIGLQTRMQTAIEMRAVAEPYIRRRAIRHLEKGRIVILGGGTGLPFITTDTAAAIRGLELGCQAIFKATRVDGVYTDDPLKNPKAKKFTTLSFRRALEDEKISIIDKAAISLCQENKLPIVVYNLYEAGRFRKAVCGEVIGTIIK